MADANYFSGFYFVEGDQTYGKIDLSFGLKSEISNYTNDNVSTSFMDIINKFTKPLAIARNDGTYSQKLYVENAAFEGSPEDRQAINANDARWKNIFSIANYIYFQAPETRTRDSVNAVLAQSELDPAINATTFVGYIPDSLSITKTASGTRINKFSFNFRWDVSTVYVMTMYVNPQYFVEEFISDSPAIFVYYTADKDITPDEQVGTLTSIFNNIGVEYMNNYKSFEVPLYSTAVNADKQRFHIYTKSYVIPTNPLEDVTILDAIQAKIKSQEPDLSSDQLISKYPTIFINESRAIWCLFDDNPTIKKLQITDPLNPGSTVYYNANPVTKTRIDSEISESAILSGNADLGGYNMYEVTTIGNGRWFPIIIAGRNGALTDKVPKYLPIYDDIESVTSEGNNARNFFQYLDQCVNYILGKNVLSDVQKTNMGITETTEYVGFKMLGANWKIYKRGRTTVFDQP